MLVFLTALFLTSPPDAGKLAADLLVTNQPRTVIKSWQQGQTPTLQSVKTARRGEPVAAFVVLSSCSLDKQGHCDVRAKLLLVDPLRKEYGEPKDSKVWVGKPPPAAGTSQLGAGYMMIEIEPGDPPGRYRVKAHVIDRVAGTSLDREWSFEVAP